MLGSTVLDVAIGLVLIYSLLSLICSTINEGISNFLGLRAATLKQGLENLLGSDLASKLYQHHLVKGLVQKDALPWKRRPSYIPTRTFILTALDTLNGGFPTTVDEVRLAVQKIQDPDIQRAILALVDEARGDFDKLKQNLGVWFDHSMDRVSGWYRRKVQTFILIIAILVSFGLGADTIFTVKALGGNPVLRAALVKVATDKVNTGSQSKPQGGATGGTPTAGNAAQGAGQTNPNQKPPQTTDQSGAAAGASGANNAAPGTVPNVQDQNPAQTRPNTSAPGSGAPGQTTQNENQADALKKSAQDLKNDLQEFDTLNIPSFPIWNVHEEWKTDPENRKGEGKTWYEYVIYWFGRHLLGFFLTAVALSLGAPFWFDLLNKLVSLRSTGQKPKPEAATNQPS